MVGVMVVEAEEVATRAGVEAAGVMAVVAAVEKVEAGWEEAVVLLDHRTELLVGRMVAVVKVKVGEVAAVGAGVVAAIWVSEARVGGATAMPVWTASGVLSQLEHQDSADQIHS